MCQSGEHCYKKEFTDDDDDDDDGVRRIITDVAFSHEDDVYYARYVLKGEKEITDTSNR